MDVARAARVEEDVTLADARTSLELITAAYFSGQTGESVALPLGADHPYYSSWLPQSERRD